MKAAGIVPRDRKAFRLCIASEDSSKLLNCEIWPAHITVSKWTYQNRPTGQTTGSTAQAPPRATDVTNAAAWVRTALPQPANDEY